MPTRLRNALPWLLGFFLVGNIYLLPGNAHSPRATDLIGITLLAGAVLRMTGSGVSPQALATLAALAALPLGWAIFATASGDAPTAVMSMRWLLAMPWGLALMEYASTQRGRDGIARGIWWGVVLNVFVLLLQYRGMLGLTIRSGLAAADSVREWVNMGMRLPGMSASSNASGAVAGLAVPAALYLYFTGRSRIWLPLVSMALLAASTHFTSSRSPAIVSVLTILLVSAVSRRPRRALTLLAACVAISIPALATFGLPGGAVRWTDTSSMEVNSSERFITARNAIDISIDHPLGLGVTAGNKAILEKFEIPATHNAILYISVIYGPALAVALLLILVVTAARPLVNPSGRWALPGFLAIETLGLFMFEDHLNNPTFIILLVWMAAMLSRSAARIPQSREGPLS